jgi:hypothetical protein
VTQSEEEKELYTRYNKDNKEELEIIEKTLLANKYPQSIEDISVDFDKVDAKLSELYAQERDEKNQLVGKYDKENEDGTSTSKPYFFDEVYYKDLRPQMLNKLEDYKEAFEAIFTKESVRDHPKMQELKQVHDLIHFTYVSRNNFYRRGVVSGPLVEHVHYDMINHIQRGNLQILTNPNLLI